MTHTPSAEELKVLIEIVEDWYKEYCGPDVVDKDYDTARSALARLKQPQAAGDMKCPYAIAGDDGTAKQCIERGHCGCDNVDLFKAGMLRAADMVREHGGPAMPFVWLAQIIYNEADKLKETKE